MIAATGNAVQVTGATGTISNTGTISQIGSAQANGVLLGVGGTVSNTGTITSQGSSGAGVNFGAGGTLVNGDQYSGNAVISGYGNGVLGGSGSTSITNQGVIRSTGSISGAGINIQSGSINNRGNIIGTTVGISINSGIGTLTNNGGVGTTADNSTTLLLAGGGTIINSGGSIRNSGHTPGSVAIRIGPDASGTISNEGGFVFGAGISAYDSAIVTGTAGGPSTVLNANSRISSTGTVLGGFPAILLRDGGTVTNSESRIERSAIQGYGGAVYIFGGRGTVNNNYGTMQATGTLHDGVYLGFGGTVTNSGGITGRNGVELHNAGTVANYGGFITGTGSGNAGAVFLEGSYSPGTFLVTNKADFIQGTANGVLIRGSGIVRNGPFVQPPFRIGGHTPAITGGTFGVDIAGVGTIDNFGTIVSTAPVSSAAGAGVYLQNGGQLTNEAGASITAQRAAVSLGGAAKTNASVLVSNSGLLTGNVGVQIGRGDTGNNTIVNFGTITGTGGTAIDLGNDGAQIVIEPGSKLNGGIANFRPGDSIDLPGVNAVSLGYANGTLTLFDQTTTAVAQLSVSTPYITPQFVEAPDGGGGTLVTVAPPSLFGFRFSYTDGSSYYTGTVVDDGRFGYGAIADGPGIQQVFDGSGRLLGAYAIYREGATTLPAGTVTLSRYFSFQTGQSYSPDPTVSGGAGGLGSETGVINANGVTASFGDTMVAALPFSNPGFAIPGVDVSDPTMALVQTYQQVLGRDPDAGGLFAYQNALTEGSSLGQVRSGIAHSAEAQNDLNRIYGDVLGRAAEPDGLATYENVLAGGNTLAHVRLMIAQSPEAEGDLNLIYRQVLGRDADNGGLDIYTAALASGAGLADVRSGIAHSAEADTDLNRIYGDVLGRAADPGGLATYENVLGRGNTLADVRFMIAQSSEAEGDLDLIYRQVLGRDADNGGLDTYRATLAGGAGLADVRSGIAHSAEAQNDLSLIYGQVLGRSPDPGGLATYEDALAGGWSLGQVRSDIAHSAEAQAGGPRLS